MVYDGSARGSSFSFKRVMTYPEVKTLIILSFLEQAASYLSSDADKPLQET